MDEVIGEEWFKLIGGEFSKHHMTELSNFLVNERKIKNIYPKSTYDVFRIFKSLPYSEVKVVLIGQD